MAKTSKSKAKEFKRIAIKDKSFFNDIKEYNSLQKDIKTLKDSSDLIFNELKSVSKEKWLEDYGNNFNNPGTVILESSVDGETAELTFLPSDRYLKINKEKAFELKETYGEDIIESESTYTIDTKMAKKYGKIITKLILESDEIEEKDKKKIIKLDKTYSVKKGSIDNLSKYGDVEEVFKEINPVVSIKNISLIKS
jgi:hypothetical protein